MSPTDIWYTAGTGEVTQGNAATSVGVTWSERCASQWGRNNALSMLFQPHRTCYTSTSIEVDSVRILTVLSAKGMRQGLTKSLSGRPGQVNFEIGLVTFHSHLPDEQWRKPRHSLWEFSSRWKPSTASRVFTDLLSNSPKCWPRFSPGYEGTENMFYFLNVVYILNPRWKFRYVIIFTLLK